MAAINEFRHLMPDIKEGNLAISKLWMYRWEYFSHPGPIDSSDVMCMHGYLKSHVQSNDPHMFVACKRFHNITMEKKDSPPFFPPSFPLMSFCNQ